MPNADKAALRAHFAKTLRTLRVLRGLSQEEFDGVSGRTYMSALERGLKVPTLGKIEDLAGVLKLHPATFLALCYCAHLSEGEFSDLWKTVGAEATEILALHFKHHAG